MTTTTRLDVKECDAQGLVDSLAPNQNGTRNAPVTGLVVGILISICDEGVCSVNFNGNPALNPVLAKALASITPADIGKTVALLFERGDIRQPIIMGLLHNSAHDSCNVPTTDSALFGQAMQIQSDDDEITVIANRKLTLKCGSASITLDIDGNVEIRGSHILSRAAGQNRIKGSAISLN